MPVTCFNILDRYEDRYGNPRYVDKQKRVLANLCANDLLICATKAKLGIRTSDRDIVANTIEGSLSNKS